VKVWILAALFGSAAVPATAESVNVSASRMIDVLAGKVIENPLITIVDWRSARKQMSERLSSGVTGT
jgi:hypothetical protein